MKPTKVTVEEGIAVAYCEPTHENEFFIANTEGGMLIGSIVRLKLLDLDHGIDFGSGIESGDYSALEDYIRHEENGFRRVIQSQAELGEIVGENNGEYYAILRSGFYETLPETDE